MSTSNIQILFFQHLKKQLSPHLSMVDEVADLLGISNDSAYRRIRGEKPIDLEEIEKLCSHFKISMDQLLNLKSNAFIFEGLIFEHSNTVFEDWLENVRREFQILNSFEKKHVSFLMKDIPPFTHFLIPEVTAFKFFVWMKSILHYESMKAVKFSFDDPRYDKFHPISNDIITLYNKIPTTEMWNIDIINSTLRQIEFHMEAGSFKNKEDVRLLLTKVEELMNHLEKQAELGLKSKIGEKPKADAAEYRLFITEPIMGDNTFFVELGDTRVTYLNHSVLYFVVTRDERFNNAMFENLGNLIKKSTLISTVGEKERNQFFNHLRQKIHKRLTSLQ